MPLAPLTSDTLAWTAWYQRYAAWVSDQQAWSSRLLTVVREEVAAGRLSSDVMQTAARGFLEQRLPDYLIAMAELNSDLASDVLGVADESLERLADALIGGSQPRTSPTASWSTSAASSAPPSRSASSSRTPGPNRR